MLAGGGIIVRCHLIVELFLFFVLLCYYVRERVLLMCIVWFRERREMMKVGVFGEWNLAKSWKKDLGKFGRNSKTAHARSFIN